jgi:hypothetical protein
MNEDAVQFSQICLHGRDVNILEGSVHNVKENAESLVVATKETGLEVNADKSKKPLQSWTDPEGSRRLRLPDFMTIST